MAGINFDLSSYGYLGSTATGASSVPIDDPDQTLLYMEQGFSNILTSLLFAAEGSDDDSGSYDTDFFSSSDSSYDSLDVYSNYYAAQMSILQQDYFNTVNVDELNEYSALISKEATYYHNGQISTGIIESVVIENNKPYFKIDGETIDASSISEIREA
jgi:hypothetical protein